MGTPQLKPSSASYISGILQGKAYRTMQNHLSDTLAAFELTIPEWKVLGLIYDNGPLRVSDLAEILDVDPPLITKLVNNLEEKKLVERVGDVNDKRSARIKVTMKGEHRISRIEPEVRAMLGQLLQGLTVKDMDIYKKVLATIVAQGKVLTVKKNYLIQ